VSDLAKADLLLVDVREPQEAEIARIDGARNIPLARATARLSSCRATERSHAVSSRSALARRAKFSKGRDSPTCGVWRVH